MVQVPARLGLLQPALRPGIVRLGPDGGSMAAPRPPRRRSGTASHAPGAQPLLEETSMTDTFHSHATLELAGREVKIARLAALETAAAGEGRSIARLPYALRILLENLLRREDGIVVTAAEIEALAAWDPAAPPSREIAFMPARVLLQDFTGVPAVVDLAAMRDAISAMGGDPTRINPLQPVELVIDHSVQVDEYGRDAAFLVNVELEFERNGERYAFLRWGQTAFRNFRVVPPGTGICHQVNLEYLARVVIGGDRRRRRLGLSRHPRRHRLAHHDGQRPRRPRLGRRRHRGRGRHARPAGLHAHPAGRRLPADRRPARGGDGDRPRPHASPRCCARRASSASSSSSTGPASPACRSPTAPPSPTWRPSTAPPAASSRSTAWRSTTSASPAGRRSAWRSSRPT